MQVGLVDRPTSGLGYGFRVALHGAPHVRKVAVQVVDDGPAVERSGAVVPDCAGTEKRFDVVADVAKP